MDLNTYWFSNPKIWFSSTAKNDTEISQLYGHLIEDTEIHKKYEALIQAQRQGPEQKLLYLEFILITDQLIKHVDRSVFNERIDTYGAYALTVSLIVIKNDALFSSYSPDEKCFIMMPLRHSNKLYYNEMILDIVRRLRSENDCPVYRRFYKATLLRLAKINNKNSLLSLEISSGSGLGILSTDITWEDIIPILDTKSIKKCVKHIPSIYVNLDSEPIIKTCKNVIRCGGHQNSLALSISGGVDSMVVAYAFSYIRMRYPEESISISAIHIDYDNRNTSKYDAELCKYWCNELDIPLCVRKITEIHRSRDKDRDIYETVTRDIRYGMYKLMERNIILGHNKDDTIENIFANIIKQKNYDNLLGMKDISSMEGTEHKIIRPMLSILKKDIYDFAQKYSIPYVYDSTPEWSERGLKRDVLLPFLNKFDSRLIPGMEQFVEYVSSIHSVYQITIDGLINYKKGENGCICSIDKSIINYDTMVLKSVLSKICKHYSLPYISQKGVINTFKLLHDGRCGKIILNKCLFLRRLDNIDVCISK